MKTRRALLVEPRKFEIIELDVQPEAGQVLVKVAACGLCNWELNHWKGDLGTFPQTLGHEMGGEIVQVGEGVQELKVGDVVTGAATSMCGFSDYVVMNEKECFKVNEDINPTHAIGEPLKCIVTVLRATVPEAGDYGIVFGAGPMGLWCVQGLGSSLIAKLIVVDVDEKKLELAKKNGATHTINPKVDNVVECVSKITGGHMADFAIEGTGNPGVVNNAIACLKVGRGRLSLMSSYEAEGAPINLKMAMEKSIEVKVPHYMHCLDQNDEFRRATECLNNKTFVMDDIITHVFTLDNIQTAFETLEHKPIEYIKGIVVPR